MNTTVKIFLSVCILVGHLALVFLAIGGLGIGCFIGGIEFYKSMIPSTENAFGIALISGISIFFIGIAVIQYYIDHLFKPITNSILRKLNLSRLE